MRLVISSGHGKYVRGASGYIDEVDEARKVVDKVAEQIGPDAIPYHDNVSTSQNENLNRIVDFHNSKSRDLDVSVHFNASQTTSNPVGTECWWVTQKELAIKMAKGIATASGLKDRGEKYSNDLFFLNNTAKPSILIEVCFVDSKADVEIYHSKFDQICGAITKNLGGDTDESLPPIPPVATGDEETIKKIAMNSAIAKYNWKDRGIAPPGYTKGFALAFAQVLRKYLIGNLAALEMAKANTHNDSKDVLSWYNSNFEALGLSNEVEGVETLRHLFALQMGLGMRESSGRHCEGRDMSATNVTSDTCEAGLYQTSYNAHTATPRFDEVMSDYEDELYKGYLEVFKEGVYCNSSSWASYGSGPGRIFQDMCKEQPAFAVETCALTLRNLRQHYGPINRKEAELRHEADDMLHAVQHQVESMV
jgi:hypothetical protein